MHQSTLLVKLTYCLQAAGLLARHRRQGRQASLRLIQPPESPAQRPAEVLGTRMHAQLTVLSIILHYASTLGIGSGHRQLIAVTCIAEHA